MKFKVQRSGSWVLLRDGRSAVEARFRRTTLSTAVRLSMLVMGGVSLFGGEAIAGPANSFSVGVLGLNTGVNSCLNSTVSGVATSLSVCDSGGGNSQAGILSYDNSGNWGAWMVATGPTQIGMGVGANQLYINTNGLFATAKLDMASKNITSLAAGAVSSTSADAINGSQLHGTASSIASALGGSSAVQSNGTVSAPTYSVGGTTVNSVGAALTNIDGRTTTNTSNITNLANGTAGLVQRNTTNGNITVGGANNGTQVSIAGTAGNRRLIGVLAGAVSSTSAEAVNGSQLHGVANNVATALGGGAAINATTGAWTAPAFAVNGTTFPNVNAALGNIDGRTTTNATNIASLSNGTAGLVQQNATTRNITMGAATDGTQVSIAGTTGGATPAVINRRLTGVGAGIVSSSSVDAINGSQLQATAASVASALGGTSAVQSDGTLSAPSYSVGGSTVNNVGAAISNVDGRTTQNAAEISNLSSGAAGLVRQDATSRNISVGGATDGTQVSIAGAAGNRVLTGVAAGAVSATSVDALNGSQLHGNATSVANALGGGATVNPDGTVSAPNYSVGTGTVNSVGAAISNIDGRTTTNTGNIAQNTSDIAGNTSAINNLSTAIGNGTTGLVQQAAGSRNITVGAATDGTQVSIAGTAGNRVLTSVAAGAVSAASVDAVNGSQLYGSASPVASALGGGSAVQPNGTVSAPSYAVGGTTVNNVGAAVSNLDGRTSTNTSNIAQNTTDIAGNTSAIGNLSTAINNGTTGLVQQASPTGDVTVAAATGGSRVNLAGTSGNRVLAGVAAGTVGASSAEAVNGSQLHGTANSVASALGGGAAVNADGTLSAPAYTVGGATVNTVAGAVSKLDGRVTQNSSGIAANTAAIDSLANGTAGLVQQDATTRNISVGQNTDGSTVNFTGTGGARVLTGVAAGGVSATSLDAINGSQLYASVNSMAMALGAGAGVGPNGALIPPSYTVGGTTVHSVGAAVSNLDGRVTNVNNSVSNITNQINNGTVGMVQQAPGSSTITLGSNTGGTTVNMTGTDGNRVVTGVANGSIGQGSSDAVNGGQIYTMQQQLGQIGMTTTALSTDSSGTGGNSGNGAGAPAAAATVKPGTNGVALGNGASVQAANSAAVGPNSVADRANTVSVGSVGNERVIANVADPVMDTDAVNQRTLNNAMQSANSYTDQRVNQLQNDLGTTNRKAYSGVAAATALTMVPDVDLGKSFAMGIGASSYQGYGATAVGVSVRVNERVKVKAGAGFSSAGTTAGVGASFQW